MKKYFALFAAVALFSALNASASKDDTKDDDRSFNPKRCFKLCMKEINDRDKCTYICDPDIDPRK